MNGKALIASVVLATTLAACSKQAGPERPGFHIGEVNFSYDLPKGFCPASQDWKRSFESIAAQNYDKAIVGQLVDCVENARYANSPNYIVILTYSDPARQVLNRDGLMKDFKPSMDPAQFLGFLNSDKPFSELQKAVAGLPGKPLGEAGNAFPEVNDDRCIYSGGRYGQPPLTPETSGTVINCIASIGDRQVMIMYNGDGKQDLLAMTRTVAGLAKSIEVSD